LSFWSESLIPPDCRKRFLILTNVHHQRYQFLRLSIRHKTASPPSADLQRRRSCFYLAKAIVEAIAKYMSLYSSYRPSGFVLTCSLVECIYYIVPKQLDQSDVIPLNTIQSTLREAGNLLRTLSHTVGAASRAFNALECILLPEKDAPSDPLNNNQDELLKLEKRSSSGRPIGPAFNQMHGTSSALEITGERKALPDSFPAPLTTSSSILQQSYEPSQSTSDSFRSNGYLNDSRAAPTAGAAIPGFGQAFPSLISSTPITFDADMEWGSIGNDALDENFLLDGVYSFLNADVMPLGSRT
jgi:hypothetical protein